MVTNIAKITLKGNDKLVVYSLNARSLKTVNHNCHELLSLKTMLYTEAPDFFGITETWLDTNILDSEIDFDNYNVFRKDRCDGRGVVSYFMLKMCLHVLEDLI